MFKPKGKLLFSRSYRAQGRDKDQPGRRKLIGDLGAEGILGPVEPRRTRDYTRGANGEDSQLPLKRT